MSFKLFLILLITIFANNARGTSMYKRFAKPETKIIGGMTAPDGGIPYQVSLRNIISHFCGATLLNKRWVLTAAHCGVAFSAEEVTVVVGTNSVVMGGDKYDVEKIVNHEDYNGTTILNDISLMKVTKDIKFSNRVQPIDLPGGETKPGANILLTGWGRETSKDDPIPANLQMINQTVLSLETCKDYMSDINVVTENQICTITTSGAGACQGDSGGPLVENNRVVGIVSWGVDCDLHYPDINTYVYSYKDWIKKYIDDV